MLQVRKVRVNDVALREIKYPAAPGSPGEGVLLKAETQLGDVIGRTSSIPAKETLPWASVRMNLGIPNAVPPGRELLVAVADQPRSNSFSGACGPFAMDGRVDIPDGDFYSFVISGQSMGKTAKDDIEVRFHGNEAWEFVRSLLWNWLRYEEDSGGKKKESPVLDDPFLECGCPKSHIPNHDEHAPYKCLRESCKEGCTGMLLGLLECGCEPDHSHRADGCNEDDCVSCQI